MTAILLVVYYFIYEANYDRGYVKYRKQIKTKRSRVRTG